MKHQTKAHRTRGRRSKGGERVERKQGKYDAVKAPVIVPGTVLTGILLCDRTPKLVPLAGGASVKVYIEGDLGECVHGDVVRAKITGRESKHIYHAKIVARLSGDADALSRTKALAAGFGLRMTFDADTLAEAQRVSAQPVSSGAGERFDFRQTMCFTIDGADAKDFDDAVGIGDAPAGLTRLYVHIADVSHYVRVDTSLDAEAYARGTSVYFPNMVLPMLPEALSNGCCSLRPDEDRYTLSCVMDVDASGTVRDRFITRGIIRSARRFTYDEVNALLQDEKTLSTCPQGEALKRLCALAHTLHRRRVERGCVDIDLPEARIAVDENGEVTDVTAPVRGESERMIEECMLLANETVARLLRERSLPALYRVHEQPDPEKIDALKRFAKKAGFLVKEIRQPVSPRMLAALLRQAEGKSVYPALAMLTMRSMQKARYDDAPLGHFALAAEDYCHFTSPIRRYPDLLVHRSIGAWLDGDAQAQKKLRMMMDEAAQRTSESEIVAMDAERAVDRMMMARWAEKHIGEEFDARVSGVTSAGFFASLDNLVEGMVPVWTLKDEFVCDEDSQCLRGVYTGARYAVGKVVRVRIAGVQQALGRIDFELMVEAQQKKEKREDEQL